MFPEFIHIVACVRNSFFLSLSNIPLYANAMFQLSIYLSMDFWVVSFGYCEKCCWPHGCAIRTVQKLLAGGGVLAFSCLGYIPSHGIAETYNSVFNFLRNHNTVFHSVPFYTSPSNAWGFQFLHISNTWFLSIYLFTYVFENSCLNGCEVR